MKRSLMIKVNTRADTHTSTQKHMHNHKKVSKFKAEIYHHCLSVDPAKKNKLKNDKTLQHFPRKMFT